MFALVALVFAGAVYMAFIDTTSLPELYTGAAITLLAALAVAAVRSHGVSEASIIPAWVARGWRPAARIPLDVAIVCYSGIAQLLAPARRRGRFVAIPFAPDEHDAARNVGRRALAQALGSLAPNTIIIGVDTSRRLIIAHQLRPRVDRAALDPMDLG